MDVMTLLTADAFTMLMLGVSTGLLIGVIPGLGGVFGLSILVPLTFGMEPESAISLLMGLAAAVTISDTIPAILIGVPGSAGASPTALDGHALAKQGQAGRAFIAAYTSAFFGGIFGALVLLAAIPFMTVAASWLKIPDYFAVAMLGLSCVVLLNGMKPREGLASALMGVTFSFIGLDSFTGEERWTFGSLYLWDGLPISIVLLSMFALPEIGPLLVRGRISARDVGFRKEDIILGMRDVWREKGLVVKSSALACIVGMIPGIGLSVISWLVYGIASRHRGDGPDFGQGNIRGVIAPESAANATEGGTLIPTLALGLPGSASMTLILSALIIQGIEPGPVLIAQHREIVVAIVMALLLANTIGSVMSLALTPLLVRIALLRANIVVAITVMAVSLSVTLPTPTLPVVLVLVIFGTLGILMRQQGWSRPSFVLGLVLGPILEKNFMLATQLNGFHWLLRPSIIGAVVVLIAVLFMRRKYAHKHLREASHPEGGPLQWALIALSFALIALVAAGSYSFKMQAVVFPIATAGGLFVVTLALAKSAIYSGISPISQLPKALQADAKILLLLLAFVAMSLIIGTAPAVFFSVTIFSSPGQKKWWHSSVVGAICAFFVGGLEFSLYGL